SRFCKLLSWGLPKAYSIGSPDLLDRVAQRDPRDQREATAYREEHKAADQPEMQPGDRQEMRQAGVAKRLFHFFGHRAALAGYHRRGDPARRAGQRGGDAPGHLVA